MAMTLTQPLLDKAGLVLVVGQDGLFEWSAAGRSQTEVVNMLRDIADAIEAEDWS